MAVSYIFWKQPSLISLEDQKLLLDYQIQLSKNNQFADRTDIPFVIGEPKNLKLGFKKTKSLVQFCKNQKVHWTMLVSTMGVDLGSPISLVIGYGIPRYFRCFLAKCDIPLIELSDKEIKSAIAGYVNSGKACEYTLKCLSEYGYQNEYLLPAFDEEDNFVWTPYERSSAA